MINVIEYNFVVNSSYFSFLFLFIMQIHLIFSAKLIKFIKYTIRMYISLQGKEMGYYRRDNYENIQMGTNLDP